MPLYSTTAILGAVEFPFCPCYGYDADGRDIGCGVTVDSDTGLVQRVIFDKNNLPILDGYGHPEIPGAVEGERPLQTVQFRPPIVFERARRVFVFRECQCQVDLDGAYHDSIQCPLLGLPRGGARQETWRDRPPLL
jgi:hypothetical protein